MAFDLRSLASNIGNTISNAWNSKKRKEVSAGINTAVNQGAQNLATVAKSSYVQAKPVVQGAVKQMASTVGQAIKTNAPKVTAAVASGATTAGNSLRSLVTNYIDSKKPLIDPRSSTQIALDRQKIATPTTPIKIVTKTQVSPTATPSPQKVGVKTIEGFNRPGSGVNYYETIHQAAANNGLHPAVLAGLLFQESGIQPGKVNTSPVVDANGNAVLDANGKQVYSYDRGIAQINSKAHPEISDLQANDPIFAINWAAKELGDNLKYFNGDINRAVAAYNVGKGGASIKGPEVYGGGPRGQTYLNSMAQNLTSDLQKKLGFKTGAIVSPKQTYQPQTLKPKTNIKIKKK